MLNSQSLLLLVSVMSVGMIFDAHAYRQLSGYGGGGSGLSGYNNGGGGYGSSLYSRGGGYLSVSTGGSIHRPHRSAHQARMARKRAQEALDAVRYSLPPCGVYLRVPASCKQRGYL